MAGHPAPAALILTAHGTREPAGVELLERITVRVGAALDTQVRLAFLDVLGPTPEGVLHAVGRTGPAVIVPALLARGHHALIDLPGRVAAGGHPDVTLTPILGRSAGIAAILADGLRRSGWRRGDAVVLAAAGTSHPLGMADLHQARRMLARQLGTPVQLALAAGRPGVAETVAAVRERGAPRVGVASYLIAGGLFQKRLEDSGADFVTRPLGFAPAMVGLVADRFAQACSWAA